MFFYFLVYQKMLIVKSGVWIIEILLVLDRGVQEELVRRLTGLKER